MGLQLKLYMRFMCSTEMHATYDIVRFGQAVRAQN